MQSERVLPSELDEETIRDFFQKNVLGVGGQVFDINHSRTTSWQWEVIAAPIENLHCIEEELPVVIEGIDSKSKVEDRQGLSSPVLHLTERKKDKWFIVYGKNSDERDWNSSDLTKAETPRDAAEKRGSLHYDEVKIVELDTDNFGNPSTFDKEDIGL